MFVLRFDFRLAPFSPSTMGELYAASLDMCEWGEQHGALTAMFSEHHGASDGYLPSPLIMAGAAAARTSSLPINVGALLLLMYDPIKLAEDMVVLDHLSGGRVSYTIGLGYRDSEYEMFGIDRATRGAEIEERIGVVQRALAGEAFTWRGRNVAVRPEPTAEGSPVLAYGGGSSAAARRAARLGMMLFPQTTDPTLAAAYDTEAERVGNPPGMTMSPGAGSPTTLFVARDVDAGWHKYGPYMLHDAQIYREWMGADSNASSLSHASSVQELRAENGAYRVVTPAEAVELQQTYFALALQPLCGGLPPDLAWESLRLIETEVIPALAN